MEQHGAIRPLDRPQIPSRYLMGALVQARTRAETLGVKSDRVTDYASFYTLQRFGAALIRPSLKMTRDVPTPQQDNFSKYQAEQLGEQGYDWLIQKARDIVGLPQPSQEQRTEVETMYESTKIHLTNEVFSILLGFMNKWQQGKEVTLDEGAKEQLQTSLIALEAQIDQRFSANTSV